MISFFFIQYLFPLLILMGGAILYFRIARYFNIIDKPNERSSHKLPTIRGGGVIFLMSALLFYFWTGYPYPYLLIALLISGIISFIDDIRTLPNWIKFSAHIISVILVFYQCGLLTTATPLFLIGTGILIIGVINAYNFMDGINGITGLYSIAVILPLYTSETDIKIRLLELFTLMGLCVFNFFNTRSRAICFAGDVGSICMAILVIFLLITRIKETSVLIYIGFLLIYGIDSVYTILQRLLMKENIFKPHRKHLYQYLSNEKKIPQLLVSSVFAILQLIINYSILNNYLNYRGLLTITIFFTAIYWYIKAPYIILDKLKKTNKPLNKKQIF